MSLEMMDDYEAFCKAFRRSVHENQDQGNLDLGEPHSPTLFPIEEVGVELLMVVASAVYTIIESLH